MNVLEKDQKCFFPLCQTQRHSGAYRTGRLTTWVGYALPPVDTGCWFWSRICVQTPWWAPYKLAHSRTFVLSPGWGRETVWPEFLLWLTLGLTWLPLGKGLHPPTQSIQLECVLRATFPWQVVAPSLWQQ